MIAGSSYCFRGGRAPNRLQNKMSSTTRLKVALPPPPEESSEDSNDNINQSNNTSSWRKFILKLSQLALRDYEWRSDVWAATEADRNIEASLARLVGQETPLYIRPMDASEATMGPLGRWEKAAVAWIRGVIDEEGRRAQTIIQRQGQVVRPMEVLETTMSETDNEYERQQQQDQQQLGPLGYMERQVSDFLQSIRRAEQARVQTKTLQPKDLPEDVRGPLGRLEDMVSRFWKELREAEILRAEQSRRRGGELVRPIDVPGPLGEWERQVAALFQAEERRAMERNRNDGKVVRPKDATYPGPLGEWERGIYEWYDQLRLEENERFKSIQRILQDRRPMEQDRKSILGVSEAIVVGLLRAPQLVASVIRRVRELLASEVLEEDFGDSTAQEGSKRLSKNKEPPFE
jgi:hypothetical protein